jgi:hypothetical protein
MEATTQNDQLGSRGSDFGSGEEEAGAESDVEDNADADEEEEETGMAEHNKVGCHPTFNSDIASPTGIHVNFNNISCQGHGTTPPIL